MNHVLEMYIQTIPVIKDALGMDIMMSITDGYEFLAYWRGDKMVADIHVGDPLSHDDPMWTSFTTGKKLEQICPADVYGFAFRAITIAIKDRTQIVGTMGSAISLETETFTTNASNKLLESIDFVQSEMDRINEYGNVIKESSGNIKECAEEILDNVSEVQTFASAIREISNSTNMLSLNASIEAARSGEQGRGFAVVAEQMRKLANDTKVASEEILDILTKFTEDIDKMKNSLDRQESSQSQQTELSEQMVDEVRKIDEITRQVIEKINS